MIEPWQIGFKGRLPRSEHVAAFTAQDPPHRAATVAGAPNDLLDRDPVFGEREDRRIGLLPVTIPFVLEPLGGREQLGLDRHRADGASDLTH
jgi:hypothetical protein